MYGAKKTPYAFPARALKSGDEWIATNAPVDGWLVSDRILIPGVDPLANKDELLEIAEISADRLRIRFTQPLAFDHPSQIADGIPISNLTRNVIISSADKTSLGARGHVMIMHRQTGTIIDSVAFEGLGRTDAARAQSTPKVDAQGILKPGSDDNTIGRYALHFHVRSGARIEVPPHVVRNSVIVDSPKLGLVNHGAHVLAEGNITYNITGAHYFAENGSEIGAFLGNVAIRSSGSGDRIRARDMTYDFGHGGHGFWTQSGGVQISGNYSFGHPEGAYVIFGYPFLEEGKTVFFDGHNIGNPQYADSLGQVLISNVNFTFENNVAAGSGTGLEIWNHKIYNNHDEPSLVENFTAWGIKNFGVFAPYTKNVVMRNLYLIGDAASGSATGLAGNTLTENLTIDRITVTGFTSGIVLPRRGHNVLREATLSNARNLEIASANKPDRMLDLVNIKFYPRQSTASPSSHRQNQIGTKEDVDILFRELMIPENGDVAMLFENDRILLSDSSGVRHLFFATQLADTIVLRDNGPSVLQGLSAAEIFNKFGLAIGGQLAPNDARSLPRSNGWFALFDPNNSKMPPTSAPVADSGEIYPRASQHFMRSEQDIQNRWKVVEEQSNKVVFVDNEPPKFHFLPGLLPFEIHPDDVQYGYRVMGMVADRVGTKITVRAFAKEFHDLVINPDGYVRVSFTVADMAGNETKTDVALLVTEKAIRRGANINFFVQKAYCGQCGYDTLYEDIAKMFDMGSNVSFIAQ